MRWLHIIDYSAGLSRLQQHGQQNCELCVNCTCPKSWLCPSHDTNIPEKSLKTTLSIFTLLELGELSLTNICPFRVFQLSTFEWQGFHAQFCLSDCNVNVLWYLMCAHCTGTLGFLYMEIYNFASMLWQMGTKVNSVTSLLGGRYLRLAGNTFNRAEYRKKPSVWPSWTLKQDLYTLKKSSL